MATTRYPADFSATPATDYLEIKAIRRDYKSTSPTYVPAGIPGSNTLYLNMPQKLGESQSQKWMNSSLGEIGNFIGARSPSTNNPLGAAGELFGNVVKRIVENAVLGKSVQAFQKVGASSLNENGLLSATGGIVYNPNLEVLYDGPDFRTFQYQFALFTKSEADAKAINEVVRFFQYVSVPSTGAADGGAGIDPGVASTIFADTALIESAVGTGNILGSSLTTLLGGGTASNSPGTSGPTQAILNTLTSVGGSVAGTGLAGIGAILSGENRFIKQPPFLLLTYRRGGQEHPFLYSPMPCALTGLFIDYTPTGNYTVMDNFGKQNVATVVGVVITLNLTEMKNVFAEDYETKMSVARRAPGLNL